MIIPQRIYRFYLTIGSSTVEVFPLNFLESQLVNEQEGDEIFYRCKFNGSLTFTNNNGGDDFDLIYAVEVSDPYEKIYLLIERMGAYYWDGYFSTTDGFIDLDKCIFEVTPLTYDDYTLLLEETDKQYNILDCVPVMANRVSTRAKRGSIDNVYNRNIWLAKLTEDNVLQYLAEKIAGVTVTVQSNFFNVTPNYVTLAANKLLHLTIAQKSDIVRFSSSDPATTGLMSWNELMEIFWGMFQVRWDYDFGTNTIRVEHISYFTFAPGLDLRTQPMSQATNRYSYLKEKMPKYEKLKFTEADETNFVGESIWYDNNCIDPDPKSNTKETQVNITTDLEYIINTPAEIGNEGFVILCNYLYSPGVYYVESQAGSLLSTVRLNMRLSCANLQNAYYRYNRILLEGWMNRIFTDFWTAQKTKQQECSAIVCPADNYDPANEIRTELGDIYFGGELAKVRKSSLNPNGEMNFTLLYGPGHNDNTGITDPKFVSVVQNGIGLNAALSEVSVADVDLVIHTTNCAGGDDDDHVWTIPAGSIYAVTHSIVHRILLDVTVSTTGWTRDLEYDLDYACV